MTNNFIVGIHGETLHVELEGLYWFGVRNDNGDYSLVKKGKSHQEYHVCSPMDAVEDISWYRDLEEVFNLVEEQSREIESLKDKLEELEKSNGE